MVSSIYRTGSLGVGGSCIDQRLEESRLCPVWPLPKRSDYY